MTRLSLCALVVTTILSFAAPLSTACAAIVFSGDVSPSGSADWNSSTDGYIGYTSAGTVTIEDGGNLDSAYAYLGYESTASGYVTVSGTNSQWTSSDYVYVGYDGVGRMNVVNGGTVSNTKSYVGYHSNSSGAVTVDGADSTWAMDGSSSIGLSGSGVLQISNGGAVLSDVSGLGCYSGSSGTATVDGAGSTWITRILNVGLEGDGFLSITNGAVVDSSGNTSYSYLGYREQSTGTVLVSGTGSRWHASSGIFCVGNYGSGKILISEGGTVSVDYYTFIGGEDDASFGSVTVDGAGSTYLSSYFIDVGASNNGELKILNGGFVACTSSWIGQYGVGQAILDGAGSKMTITTSLWLGRTSGMLCISGGGCVSVGESITNDRVELDEHALLAIDVGRGSSLTVCQGAGKLTNDGAIRILAGAGVAAGGTYEPISAGTWSGTGTYQSLGGTWNKTTHQFTVSQVADSTAGTAVTLDLAETQRTLIVDSASGWRMGASFLKKTSSSSLSFLGTTNTGGTLSELLDTGDTVLSGWELSADGAYATDDPVYLSFDVGHAQLSGELQVWMFDGGQWTEFDAIDLTYDRTYASWTATAMGIYAVTGKLVLDGDANRDGSTNGTDLNAVLSNYNSSGDATWAMGDFNGDGSVNGTDLNTLLSNFNQTLPSSTAAVPEPAGVLLLAVMALAGLVWGAWSKRR